MSAHLDLEHPTDHWENEGGGLSQSVDDDAMSGVLRFLTEIYVVDGRAYASHSDALSKRSPLLDEQAL